LIVDHAEMFFIFVWFYLYMPVAYVLINCELGSENEIIEKIRKVSEVSEVYRVFGVYDIIVRISTSDTETLKEIIAWKIRNVDKVRSALSMIVTEDSNNY
jgi:DNA-binding Lrp family transcriptional regulator